MKITLVNKGTRNLLTCERHDGSYEVADIGPQLPYHDIAHYVVERELKLRKGFYGNIYSGYTVEQLSTKEVIQRLDVESMVSEIITRALQSLSTGACTPDQFSDLVQQELDKFGINSPLSLNKERVNQMLLHYQDLIRQWRAVAEGESLTLTLHVHQL
ncbi:hypothetical protein [Telluribacter humicola]|uniref:hypothetical protein n=1 Tax=Telluribacter humicola TaxID=1720261 RepID=UPI001A96CD94|nr:hypothetical protein [Telluribacter humicola]